MKTESRRLLELNDRLNEAAHLKQQADDQQETLQRLQVKEKGCRGEIKTLQKELKKKRRSLRTLRRITLTSMWYGLWGSKQTRIDHAVGEVRALEEEHSSKTKFIERLEEEITDYQRRCQELADAPVAFQKLLDEKEEWMEEQPDAIQKLKESSEELVFLGQQIRELDEAVQSGESALEALEKVKERLKSAASWGTLDLVGGGLLTSLAKQSEINAAKKEAEKAQQHLEMFFRELEDINQTFPIELELGGLLNFADLFLDGLLVDWFVQSKINKAQTQCNDVITEVRRSIEECRLKKEDSKDLQVAGENARQQFIAGFGL